jgi:uncharacterized protein YneF (UPF0154 family)
VEIVVVITILVAISLGAFIAEKAEVSKDNPIW